MSISATTAAVIGILGTIGTGVGTYMSYTAQKDAANTQSQFGLLNAQSAALAAKQQGQQQLLSAEIQAAAARAQQKTANNNAAAIRAQTEAESRIASENIRRSREEFSRTIGMMRAQASDSGVLETTGSPLDFLVKASEDQQMMESEMRWQDENNRRAGFRKADIELAGGRSAGLNASLFGIQGMADMAASKVAASQARMGGYASQATAAGLRAGANASLVSGVTGMATSAYQLYQNRTPPRR